MITLAGGCGSVPKDAGFADVKGKVSTRITEDVHWIRGGPEDEAVDAAVRDLLSNPLSLSGVIQVALLKNPELQARYEALGVAQADVVQAGLLENPVFGASVRFPDHDRSGSKTTTLTTEASRTITGSQPMGNTAASIMAEAMRNVSVSRSSESSRIRNEIEFSLVQNFLDLLMLPLRRDMAELQFEQVKLSVAHDLLLFVGEIKFAFYEYVAALQIVEAYESVTRATGAASEFAVRQYEAGNLSKLEMARENAFHAQALLDLAAAQSEARLARLQLNRHMGVWDADAEWRLAEPHRLERPSQLAQTSAEIEAHAIANRFDLAAMVKDLEARMFGLKTTRQWRWLGLLDLSVSTERDGDGVYVTGPALELELPIFDRGQAKIAIAESEVRESAQRVSSLAIDVRTQTRMALENLAKSEDEVDYYERVLLPAHERIVQEAQLHHNAMLIGVYALLLDKREQIETGMGYIEALKHYWMARTELELALGGTLPPATIDETPEEAVKPAEPAPAAPTHQHD
jgi:outer membrane protein, heavy metal efflux system